MKVLTNDKLLPKIESFFSYLHTHTHTHTQTLRKQAYSNILKLSPPKTESFQVKTLIFFIIPL